MLIFQSPRKQITEKMNFGFSGQKVRQKTCTKYLGASLKKKNFMTPFYGWGSTTSRLEPLREGSLLFTTKFPEIAGTHFIDLGRMKG